MPILESYKKVPELTYLMEPSWNWSRPNYLWAAGAERVIILLPGPFSLCSSKGHLALGRKKKMPSDHRGGRDAHNKAGSQAPLHPLAGWMETQQLPPLFPAIPGTATQGSPSAGDPCTGSNRLGQLPPHSIKELLLELGLGGMAPEPCQALYWGFTWGSGC